MKKKILLMGIACGLWLTACSNIEEHAEADSKAASRESSNVELLDQPFEEISSQEWETIYLTREDYDLYLSQLTAANEKGVQEISKVTRKSGKINIILNNHDGESLENLVAAPFLDAKVRQPYVHSAYYQGQQPAIVIEDLSGIVLSDTAEPLETIFP